MNPVNSSVKQELSAQAIAIHHHKQQLNFIASALQEASACQDKKLNVIHEQLFALTGQSPPLPTAHPFSRAAGTCWSFLSHCFNLSQPLPQEVPVGVHYHPAYWPGTRLGNCQMVVPHMLLTVFFHCQTQESLRSFNSRQTSLGNKEDHCPNARVVLGYIKIQ